MSVISYMKLSFNRAFDRWLKNIGERPAIAWTLSSLWLILISWLAFFWNVTLPTVKS